MKKEYFGILVASLLVMSIINPVLAENGDPSEGENDLFQENDFNDSLKRYFHEFVKAFIEMIKESGLNPNYEQIMGVGDWPPFDTSDDEYNVGIGDSDAEYIFRPDQCPSWKYYFHKGNFANRTNPRGKGKEVVIELEQPAKIYNIFDFYTNPFNTLIETSGKINFHLWMNISHLWAMITVKIYDYDPENNEFRLLGYKSGIIGGEDIEKYNISLSIGRSTIEKGHQLYGKIQAKYYIGPSRKIYFNYDSAKFSSGFEINAYPMIRVLLARGEDCSVIGSLSNFDYSNKNLSILKMLSYTGDIATIYALKCASKKYDIGFDIDYRYKGLFAGNLSSIDRDELPELYDVWVGLGLIHGLFSSTKYKEDMRYFVEHGGGYVGICGDAMAATLGINGTGNFFLDPFTDNLLNGENFEIPTYGIAKVNYDWNIWQDILTTAVGSYMPFDALQGNLPTPKQFIYRNSLITKGWWNGIKPITYTLGATMKIPEEISPRFEDLPDITPLAIFIEDSIFQKPDFLNLSFLPQSCGVSTMGRYSGVSTTYHKGRISLWGPHPDMPLGKLAFMQNEYPNMDFLIRSTIWSANSTMGDEQLDDIDMESFNRSPSVEELGLIYASLLGRASLLLTDPSSHVREFSSFISWALMIAGSACVALPIPPLFEYSELDEKFAQKLRETLPVIMEDVGKDTITMLIENISINKKIEKTIMDNVLLPVLENITPVVKNISIMGQYLEPWMTGARKGLIEIYNETNGMDIDSNQIEELIKDTTSMLNDLIKQFPVVEYDIQFEIDDEEREIHPGQSANYTLMVRNMATGKDEISLSINDVPNNWNANLSEKSVALYAKMDTNVTLTVRSPINARAGENARITIIGKSLNDPSKSDFTVANTSVNSLLVPSFTYHPENPVNDQIIKFNASSSYDIGGDITSYKWKFGDGEDRTGKVVNHSYSSDGKYKVTLTAMDDYGTINETSKYINVSFNFPPIANFSYLPESPTTQDVIRFTDESFDPDGAIISWKWEINNNITIEKNPVHQYLENGNYIVKLTVVDDKDIARSISKEIFVSNSLPISNFSWEKTSNEIKFIDKSIDLDGKIISWEWNFGDGNKSYEINPTHKYLKRGKYTITLVVTDNDRDWNEKSKEIEITLAPIANFCHSPRSPTTKDKIKFIDESIDLNGEIISWEWDFGDGSPTSTEKNPTHRYGNEGKYEVTLTVTDNEGFTSTQSMEIEVKDAREIPGFQIFFIAVVVIILFLKRVLEGRLDCSNG